MLDSIGGAAGRPALVRASSSARSPSGSRPEPGRRLYGAPSVLCALALEPAGRHAVSRSVFVPVPNVDSTLVAFRAQARSGRSSRATGPRSWRRCARRRSPTAARRSPTRSRWRAGAPDRRRSSACAPRRASIRAPAPRRCPPEAFVALAAAAQRSRDVKALAPARSISACASGRGGATATTSSRPCSRRSRRRRRSSSSRRRRRRVEAPGSPGGDTLVRARARPAGEREPATRRAGACSIDKRAPVGAGLGGGSADAGVALRLANATLPTPLEAPALLALAAGVGSDVPFFVAGSPAAELRGARRAGCEPLRLRARPVIVARLAGRDARHGRGLRRLPQPVERPRASRARARASRSPPARTCGPSRRSSRTISRTRPSASARRRRRFGDSFASAVRSSQR